MLTFWLLRDLHSVYEDMKPDNLPSSISEQTWHFDKIILKCPLTSFSIDEGEMQLKDPENKNKWAAKSKILMIILSNYYLMNDQEWSLKVNYYIYIMVFRIYCHNYNVIMLVFHVKRGQSFK